MLFVYLKRVCRIRFLYGVDKHYVGMSALSAIDLRVEDVPVGAHTPESNDIRGKITVSVLDVAE